jgi:hypothetical protein
LSTSPFLISVGDDDMDDDDNVVDRLIGHWVGHQNATQKMKVQMRTTNGVGLRLGFGVGVGNGNNREDTDTRADSAPFLPLRRPCPRAHTGAGSPNATGGRSGANKSAPAAWAHPGGSRSIFSRLQWLIAELKSRLRTFYGSNKFIDEKGSACLHGRGWMSISVDDRIRSSRRLTSRGSLAT